MNYRLIAKLVGDSLCTEGAAMLLPLLVAVIYGEGVWMTFALCILICLVLGIPLHMTPQKEGKRMHTRDGFAAVAICWIALSLFGALPYLLSGTIPNFAGALFESVSGFTTTGATVITGIENTARGILFWRSLTQWIGGIGIMSLTLALLARVGGGIGHLIEAEETGPVTEKLAPHLSSSAKLLCLVYTAITVLCFVCLALAGIGSFDAAIVAMSTTSTGGFSIHSAGIAFYNSDIVSAIVIVFMFVSGISYPVLLCTLRRKFEVIKRNEEFRMFVFLIVVATAVITLDLSIQGHFGFGRSLFYALFQSVASVTTTAYFVAPTMVWPQLSTVLLLVLILVGGCGASSSGGIKSVRVLFMFKVMRREIDKVLHPRVIKSVSLNGRRIEENMLSSTALFVFAYCAMLIIGCIVVSFDNLGFTPSLTAAIACISNDGAALSLSGEYQTFSVFSAPVKLALSACMIMGRLEIWPIVVLFFPSVWQNK